MCINYFQPTYDWGAIQQQVRDENARIEAQAAADAALRDSLAKATAPTTTVAPAPPMEPMTPMQAMFNIGSDFNEIGRRRGFASTIATGAEGDESKPFLGRKSLLG